MPRQLIHEVIPVGMLQCNCQILGDPETREALVVDPGDEVDRILAVLRKHSLTVRAIVSTHAHIDHVGGLRKLQQATGAPVLMHEDDLELYRNLDIQAAWLGMRPPDAAQVDSFVREGDTLRWGRFSAGVLHTPGHTPGSVSLYLPVDLAGNISPARQSSDSHIVPAEETGPKSADADDSSSSRGPGLLLAGDTLFAGSIGRTDLWGGSMPQILRSIHTKLLVLPDDTHVFCGHGENTTIGRERDSNPFLESS